jgi:hypothetical protein
MRLVLAAFGWGWEDCKRVQTLNEFGLGGGMRGSRDEG